MRVSDRPELDSNPEKPANRVCDDWLRGAPAEKQ